MNKVEVKEIKKRLDEFVDMLNVKWLLYNRRFLENGLGDFMGHFERCAYEGMCQAIIVLNGCWARDIDGKHIVSLFNQTSKSSWKGELKTVTTAKGTGKGD